MRLLSDIYFSRVDPIFKVLHAPSTREWIMKVANSLELLADDKPREALLFAMYHGAVVSLSQEECMLMFSKKKDKLAEHLKHATEVALTNAELLCGRNLETLQAFAIYLVSSPAHDPSLPLKLTL